MGWSQAAEDEESLKNYIAIDIGGTAIKYGLISSDGKVLERKSTPTGAELGGERSLAVNISAGRQWRS